MTKLTPINIIPNKKKKKTFVSLQFCIMTDAGKHAKHICRIEDNKLYT